MTADVTHECGRKAGLALIGFYRHCLSGLKPPCCRFQPTCSEYAWNAVSRFGLLQGSWLAFRRILRCHPFYRGPLIDPVPLRRETPLGSDETRTE